MNQNQWTAIDDFFIENLHHDEDVALDDALTTSKAAGLPDISVTPTQGKLLMLLAMTQGAKRVLEVGTLGGYSTIWLGRGLPTDGRIVTLEYDPRHADVARRNIDNAGFGEMVDIRVGKAVDSLKTLVNEVAKPFDLVFLDADKASLPDYLEWSLKLSRPGTVIIADNVTRHGDVINDASTDPHVQGVRTYLEMAGKHPRLESTAIQTIGSKGADGFAISVVKV